MKSIKDKCKALCLGGERHRWCFRLETDWLESISASRLVAGVITEVQTVGAKRRGSLLREIGKYQLLILQRAKADVDFPQNLRNFVVRCSGSPYSSF